MHRGSLAALALAVLLVTAGCSSPLGPDDVGPAETTRTTAPSDTPAPTETLTDGGTPAETTRTTAPTETDTPTAATTDTPAETPVDTAVPRENPWGDDSIVVGIAGDPSREYAPLVRDSLDFWERNDRRYVGYEVGFEVRPDAANPDVLVNFTENVPECGGVSHPAGCAPHVTDGRRIPQPAPVWVTTGLSDDSTTHVLKHEFGHLLGLTHDDAPSDVMAASSVLHSRPQTNATDRAFPWNDSTFTVYANFSSASHPDRAREQLDHALTYYEEGAPGMPDNLTFRYVDDPAAAEVVVAFTSEEACGRGTASCAGMRGADPDGDGAVETYTRLRVTLAGIPTDASGWHVGYWLAHALGAEDDAEKPPPFRNASYGDRRSEWWE